MRRSDDGNARAHQGRSDRYTRVERAVSHRQARRQVCAHHRRRLRIGRAVAVLFAREGADVAISYLPEEQRDAEETDDAVEAEGRRCVLIPGDLTQPVLRRSSSSAA